MSIFTIIGLAYAAADRGACRLCTTLFQPELSGMIPPKQIEGKDAMFLSVEDRMATLNTFTEDQL